ncbi:DUF2103 domain-containing protein [Patescibacteria group bacterium]
MSTKSHRSGGKYTGSHTTIIPAAAPVTDFVHKLREVTSIATGYIKTGLSPSRGGAHVKIGYGYNNCILLQIRGNTSQQEIRVWTDDTHKTKFTLAMELRNNGIGISFGKENEH